MESPCNITIGMATGGTIRAETLVSLLGSLPVLSERGIGITYSVQIGGYVAWNRNNIVEHALKNGSTHIMFIDNDMDFKPSSILRLVDHDKDIVGANYNARGVPGQPVVNTIKLVNPENDPNKGRTYIAEYPAQLFKCFALGTGFLLVKTKVFEKLDKPYFSEWEHADGERCTEDVDFCRRAGEAGYDIWCSPTIKVGHIGTYTY